MVDTSRHEIYIPGGDYCQQYISNFDRKKGRQHNFQTVDEIFTDLSNGHHFSEDWKAYWAKAFIFDALIGNTDRHQDNWGIIMNPDNLEMRISPVFDNGTSMGHEISARKFMTFNDGEQIGRYVSKGWHHMKWKPNDKEQTRHLELVKKLADKYPETRQVMIERLNMVSNQSFKGILDSLIAFDVPIRLSAERANLMLKLLEFRRCRLLSKLEK